MFYEKLKEERKRLSLSQTDFGKACGVTKQAQIRYEKGERQPDSDYLEKAYKTGVDVSYLLIGIRTQPVELPSDEALLLDSYRALDAEQKKMTLRFLLGGLEHLKSDQNDDDNSGGTNTGSNNKNSNNVNSNIDSNNTNSNNSKSIVSSPNSPITNSFNEHGFTEAPFIWACAVCGAMAWLLAAVATYKLETDALISMSFGSIAILLWVLTMVMAGFGYNIGKKKYDEVQAGLGSHA